MEDRLLAFISSLEIEGKIKEIIEKGQEDCKGLPEKLGRGGKAGREIFKSLKGEVKENTQARINASEELAAFVDEVIENRYMQDFMPIKNLTKNFYDLDCNQSVLEPSSLSIRTFTNLKMYVSGKIIRLFLQNDSN